ncbi:MAG: tetratricopeptide repeat protein [Rhodospirillales bacterium]|nr:tetratricopeptide repeat protein [Rhodospirillales bacterium]
MKRLLPVLCLTIAVFLGSVGVSWGADYQKGYAAYDRGDYATALREWKPLAKQGNFSAQYLLGVMYHNGKGVPQDDKSALKWFTLAAEQGYARAQYNLGVMYANGRGVIQDYVRAHMCFNIAASSGNKKASYNRDIVAKLMTSNQIETAQRLARECVRKKYKGC